MPDLQEGDQASIRSLDKQQHFTQPPARYTEAMLVKAMEEKGVGRPSTYASIISTIQDRDYVIKKDKRLAPTPLGEVVNGLMMDRFNDIIDVEFTANMEHRLDEVEEGKRQWQEVLRDFYQGFHQEMENAEEALKDTRLKVPDEETDEVCELCGRKMVIKMGRFGRFMACPGYPECKNTKPIVERMPGRCPKCGSGMLKRKSKKGYAYYACEKGAECGFMTWDVPTEFDCPSCGHTMFKKSGRGRMKPFCVNEACPNFLPEDQRGYRKKAKEGGADGGTGSPARGTGPGGKRRRRPPRRGRLRKRPPKRPQQPKQRKSPGRPSDDRGKGDWRGLGRLRGGLAAGQTGHPRSPRGDEAGENDPCPPQRGLLRELVCSNSLRGDRLENAVGLLKEELRRLDSLILSCADATRVEAGGCLAVDRHGFSQLVTERIQEPSPDHPGGRLR